MRRMTLLFALVLTLNSFLHADQKETECAFAITVDAFKSLSPTEQKKLIIAAIDHRVRSMGNFHCEGLELINLCRNENGKIVDVIQQLNGIRARHWKIGDSFRIEIERGGIDVAEPQNFLNHGLNAKSGTARTTMRFRGSDLNYGRIGVEVDKASQFWRYGYWLDGVDNANGEFFFRQVLRFQEQAKVVVTETDTIQLIVPWQPFSIDKPVGERKFQLNPEKGFLPERISSQWKQTAQAWRREEITVEESRQVRDLWMPVAVREAIYSSSFKDDSKSNDHITTITQISIGTVKDANLEVNFAEGTQVVDAIEGVTYRVGENGEPTKTERLVGSKQLNPDPKPLPNRKSPKTNLSLLVNGGFLAVLIVALALRKTVWRQAVA